MKIVKKVKSDGGFLKLDDVHLLIDGIDYDITPLVSMFLQEVDYKRGMEVEKYFFQKLPEFTKKVYRLMYESRDMMGYGINLERFDQKVLKTEIQNRIIKQYTERMLKQMELMDNWRSY